MVVASIGLRWDEPIVLKYYVNTNIVLKYYLGLPVLRCPVRIRWPMQGVMKDRDEMDVCRIAGLTDSLNLLIFGGIPMKRDDEKIRDLLFEIEAHNDPIYLFALSSDDTDDERETYYHLLLLADSGFLEVSGRGKECFRMTNAGHDFLASIRDKTVWDATKKATGHMAGVSLGILSEVAVGIVRQKLRDIGVPI